MNSQHIIPTVSTSKPFKSSAVIPAFLFVVFVVFFAWSLQAAGISIPDLIAGLPNMGQIASEMVPPATDRLWPMLKSVLVTFQMALVGTVIGIIISIPLSVLMARNFAPNSIVYSAVRGLVTFLRTVPDLAWALFFVASVGLGPFAGTLALVMETIGFCARFFAESIEEADEGSPEALKAIGAPKTSIIICSVFPTVMPSFINTSLFSFEKAVRSSVVLGLVGAGGIGAELATSMEMFRFDQSATIILMIFVLVLVVEKISSSSRRALLKKQY